MPHTIITAFYDLYNSQEKVEQYLKLGRLWSRVPAPMVIFTSDELLPALRDIRRDYPGLTTIIVQELPYLSSLERITEALEKSPIENRNLDKDVPIFHVFNISKFEMIRQAVGLNPYRTTHFAWLDFGLAKFERVNPDAIFQIVNQRMPDRIRVMMISCPPREWRGNIDKAREAFKTIRHHHAGGLITGSGEYLTRLSVWADEWHHKMLDSGWYQLDEAIISMIHVEHEAAFDVYYGDYQNIVQYHEPTADWPLIISTGNQLLAARWYSQLDHWRRTIQDVVPDAYLDQFLSIVIVYYYYYAIERNLKPRLPLVIRRLLDHPSRQQLVAINRENLKFYT